MRGARRLKLYVEKLRILTTGYVPERIEPAEFDRSFGSGAYDRLEGATERARFSLIVGHRDVLDAARILDVGCGQGVLAKRLSRAPYERYVGLDISQVAIDQAQRAVPDARNCYVVSDMMTFTSEEKFDLIVFNECLYHMEDPAAAVRHCLRFLGPEGHVSISMYETMRSRAVWRLLDMLETVESTEIVQRQGPRWTVKLMRPAFQHARAAAGN
jgi:2-polyprenyl-3-methyl-5-hydroxy-6-metoxy-1,4-benzoquinol methylase